MRIPRLLLVALSALVAGCDAPETGPRLPPGAATDSSDPGPDGSEVVRLPDSEGSQAPPAGSAMGLERPDIRVVFLGTSLTEGLGLESPTTDAWPARVAALADSSGIAMTALNAGIGGETSAGALRRLDWVMGQDPHLLVVETGANDGLRGLPVEELEANLDEIVRRVREGYPETALVIAQMEAPPNLGQDYTEAFRETFARVAAARRVPLIPFLLDGVAGITELNQRDGIHPTPEGHRMMAETAWPVLEEVLRMVAER